ncbi:pentapeptide repeat-containing protein [Streptomyces kurssanovii]|uniref:Pentapeptide repeat-containing protein n=1 Tax=Streptomyces kurssanovii TaxID=67312 RepID=A0ABV3HMN1_9ACTN
MTRYRARGASARARHFAPRGTARTASRSSSTSALTDADLTSAVLVGANRDGAVMTGTRLDGARRGSL